MPPSRPAGLFFFPGESPVPGRLRTRPARVVCDESGALNLQSSELSDGVANHEPQSNGETQPMMTEPNGAPSAVDVLVVDDDAAVRRLVRATLLDDGLSVATACDGREALEAFAGYAPRVVVVDLEMPVMNGRDLIKALREQPDQPGIVILSAHGAKRAGRELHVDAAIEKPFDPQDLLDQVRRAGLE